jgi:hypothetical protein
LLAQVDDFHVEARGVERGGDVPFGGDTHGAARVIEYSFGLHGGSFHVSFVLCSCPARGAIAARREPTGNQDPPVAKEGTKWWAVTVLFRADFLAPVGQTRGTAVLVENEVNGLLSRSGSRRFRCGSSRSTTTKR